MELSAVDRARLQGIVGDRNSRAKHVYRARIVLLAGDGLGSTRVAHAVGKSEPTVRRWLERFAAQGVDGLLRDATRPPGRPPLAKAVVERVVQLTLHELPPDATQWSARRLARAVGIGHGAVQKIWRAHGLAPHQLRTFKLSRDPQFAAKVRDVVGLYVAPPAHAVVLSVDEKSQIQALDRTQPGLPMKKGRAGTLTHDYVRNGTTTLFAALNILDGSVTGQCMLRHRHQEFLRFLNRLERDIPAGKVVHVVLDNYASHKHPKVLAWLARHPRWTFHFTPTSASPRTALPCVPAAPDRSRCDRWLNAVEGFFAKLTNRRLKRGVFHSLVDLQAAINRYLAEHNRKPRPFVWTADPNTIIAAASRGYQVLDSIQ